MSCSTGWEVIAKRSWFLNEQVPPLSHPSHHLPPAPAEDIGRRILGEDVTEKELSDAVTWPKASVAEPLRDQLLQLCRQRLDGSNPGTFGW